MGVGRRAFSTFLCFLFYLDNEPFKLGMTYRNYPDDPSHSYSVIRAWDRHLKLMGLLPIGTQDVSRVGPILQVPGGEYIVYGFDECGYLTSWRQTVPTSEVSEASHSP